MKIKLIEFGRIILCVLFIINTSCNDSDDEVLSNSNFITLFKLTNKNFSKDFEIRDSKIEGSVPYIVDEANISLIVDISNKATITPDPSTIKSIKNPINFIVTAENGEKRNYVVDIKRELNTENSIISFNLKTNFFEGDLDINNGEISSRVLPNTDLKSLKTLIVISDKATITPDPETISDYTSPVTFIVTAENGGSKEYLVTIKLMDEDYSVQCDIMNAFKWFGGDDRDDPNLDPDFAPRNVGTGQTVIVKKDTHPTKFSFFLRDPFRSDRNNIIYTGDLELRLHIRNENGDIEKTLNTTLLGPFYGGWVDFDLSPLNLLFERDKKYYFTWYLLNGEALGISSSSSGNPNGDSGVCGTVGLSATSKKRNNTFLEDWDIWNEHPWHFNFKFEGKQ
ncbi:DUF5018 domain-containing protein [Aquimarina algiphila]|uniref:DUF5018 domain-containing protein n=1 Tax=Aquimarina algiphila TaxID=2047982 RepID=UPI002493C2C3|nr:DUF5018 domain-containing protein [Aquimarina algiphila]